MIPAAGGTGPGPAPRVEGVLRQALELAGEEEWPEAHALLLGALEEDPDDPYLLCWLGMAERELGLDGPALERFRRCLAGEPEDPVLLATAGGALAAYDDPAAEAALRTAALLAPDLPQARWTYGAWLAREGLVEDALRELDAALALDPGDPVIQTERGIALALGERLAEAAEAFRRAVELDEEDGWAMVLLGLTLLEVGREAGSSPEALEEAALLLEEGARLRPHEADAQVLAALSLSAAEAEDRALEMLERARLLAGEVDAELVLEVEERLESGPEASLRFLMDALAPSSYRERLMQRP